MFQFQCQFYSSSQDADVQFCKVICDIYPGIGYWVECGGSGIADDYSKYWGWLSRRQDTGISSTASSSVLYIHASSNWIFVYQHLSLLKDETRKSFRTFLSIQMLWAVAAGALHQTASDGTNLSQFSSRLPLHAHVGWWMWLQYRLFSHVTIMEKHHSVEHLHSQQFARQVTFLSWENTVAVYMVLDVTRNHLWLNKEFWVLQESNRDLNLHWNFSVSEMEGHFIVPFFLKQVSNPSSSRHGLWNIFLELLSLF